MGAGGYFTFKGLGLCWTGPEPASPPASHLVLNRDQSRARCTAPHHAHGCMMHGRKILPIPCGHNSARGCSITHSEMSRGKSMQWREGQTVAEAGAVQMACSMAQGALLARSPGHVLPLVAQLGTQAATSPPLQDPC